MCPFSRCRFVALVALSLSVLIASGCGEKVGTISGEVKLKDKAVAEGTISFLSQVGKKKSVQGPIKDGKYTVSNVPVGDAIITIQGPPAKVPFGTKVTPTKAKPAIPPKYADPKTSGLKYTVVAGEQEHPITLEEGK
jgi:hypothetical protein